MTGLEGVGMVGDVASVEGLGMLGSAWPIMGVTDVGVTGGEGVEMITGVTDMEWVIDVIGVEGVGTVGDKEESPIFKHCALSSCTLVPNISTMDSTLLEESGR